MSTRTATYNHCNTLLPYNVHVHMQKYGPCSSQKTRSTLQISTAATSIVSQKPVQLTATFDLSPIIDQKMI